MSKNIATFSKNGEYLAYSSPDGCLKIWETSSGTLKQEYTPSSHLSATCSCLSWGPIKADYHASKKHKKSKGDVSASIASLQLIAMGTLTGDVLFYSFTNAELHSCLKNGHTSTVNCISWLPTANSLYTCSNDMHVIVWDICEAKIKTKWKAGTAPIHSVCVIDANNILCSSSTIQWWNVADRTVIKSFSGHATEICRLLPIFVDKKCSYFLSSAKEDRVLNAWLLNDNNIRGAVASFVSPNEPENIDVLSNEKEPFTMSIVSRDGALHIFKHHLNGKSKKPLQAKFSIHIASKGDNATKKPHHVPVLAASISEGLDSCLLAYGSFLKPMFERINIDDVTDDLFLIRDFSLSSAVTIEDSVSKVRHTEKSKNVKMLAPGHMTDVTLLVSTSKKRKQKKVDIKELPMEERLKALDLSEAKKQSEEEDINIKSDSMVHLLLQGIQSKDNNMLNTVLQCGDETVIQNTIKRLPLQSILLVLKVIYVRLSKQEPRNHPSLRWLNGLLAIHLPYLMSCTDIDEYLGPISQLIEARVENFYKMLKLKGCLQILLDQTAPSAIPKSAENASEPIIEYKSDSSEESDVEESRILNSDDELEYQGFQGSVDNEDETSESSASESDMDL